jgi:hypothetical protein
MFLAENFSRLKQVRVCLLWAKQTIPTNVQSVSSSKQIGDLRDTNINKISEGKTKTFINSIRGSIMNSISYSSVNIIRFLSGCTLRQIFSADKNDSSCFLHSIFSYAKYYNTLRSGYIYENHVDTASKPSLITIKIILPLFFRKSLFRCANASAKSAQQC